MRPIRMLAVLTVTLLVAGCAEREHAASTSTHAATASTSPAAEPSPMQTAMSVTSVSPATSGAWSLVSDRSQVCMVNDQFMGRPQIPVEVGGRTYYGCCEMCKGRLARDATARTATDPLSNRPVDKSEAVIARTENGSVAYFENAANFIAYGQLPRAN